MSWYLNETDGSVTLAVCSPDGACAFIGFKKGEIGSPLTREEMAKFYSDMYKVNVPVPTKTITNGFVSCKMNQRGSFATVFLATAY